MENHLPVQTRVGPVHLLVADLERALSLYEDVLAMQRRDLPDGSVALGAAALDGGAGETIVVLTPAAAAPPRPRRAPGLYHMAIRVPSRRALAQVLQRMVETHYPLDGAADHGVSEALYLADPAGNGIEIYRDTPADTWRRRDGSLEMGTGILDLESLLDDARDAPWTGFPAGSQIGHVHLKVSAIEPTLHFYHDVLGFDVTQRYGSDAVFLSAGGYHHHIGANTWESAGSVPAPAGSLGLRSYAIALPDTASLAEVARRLEQDGVTYEQHGERITVSDPSGNAIVLEVRTAASVQEPEMTLGARSRS